MFAIRLVQVAKTWPGYLDLDKSTTRVLKYLQSGTRFQAQVATCIYPGRASASSLQQTWLCKYTGTRYTVVTCTSGLSQHSAKRSGLAILYRVRWWVRMVTDGEAELILHDDECYGLYSHCPRTIE